MSDDATPDYTDDLLTARINRDFEYHAPSVGAVNDMKYLRNKARFLAAAINVNVPNGREKALALTKLEEVVMWSNAGIARNGS